MTIIVIVAITFLIPCNFDLCFWGSVADVWKTFTRNRFIYGSPILCNVALIFNWPSCRIDKRQLRCCKLIVGPNENNEEKSFHAEGRVT